MSGGKATTVWMPGTLAGLLEEGVEHSGLTRSALIVDILRTELPKRVEESRRAVRRTRFDVRTVPLDGLLWATSRTVLCGAVANDLSFMPSQMGVRNVVDQIFLTVPGSDGYWAPRLEDLDRAEEVRQFQNLVADMSIFGMLVDKSTRSAQEGFQVARGHDLYKDQWRWTCRALDVDSSGEGAEWVPTGVGGAMHERVRAVGKVSALFSRVQMPQGLWKWPLEGSDSVAYRVAEPTSDTATKVTVSNAGTAGVTFDAEILGARVLFSRSLDQDSAMAIVPFVRNKIVRAFADAEEKAILDGDTDGTHMDSDVHALGSSDARWAWDGLRKRGLANGATADASNGELTSTRLGAVRAAMGRYGLVPDRLAVIVGPASYYSVISDANVITVDKYGPDATILHGEIGRVWGMPIIVSEHVRENLNASGVYDGITTNRTYGLVVNIEEWAMGVREPLNVTVDGSPYRESYQRVATGYMRADFQNINADGSSAKDTGIVYSINITG